MQCPAVIQDTAESYSLVDGINNDIINGYEGNDTLDGGVEMTRWEAVLVTIITSSTHWTMWLLKRD